MPRLLQPLLPPAGILNRLAARASALISDAARVHTRPGRLLSFYRLIQLPIDAVCNDDKVSSIVRFLKKKQVDSAPASPSHASSVAEASHAPADAAERSDALYDHTPALELK